MAWIAEEKFESYSNGTSLNGLNGGTGWSSGWSIAGTATATVTTVPYDGSLAMTKTAGTGDVRRQLAADFSGAGVIYFAMRRASNGSGSHRVNFRSTGDSGRLSVRMLANGNLDLNSETGGGTVTLVSGYSSNTYYVVRLTINTATGTATAAVGTGAFGSTSSFGSESSSVSFTTGDWRYILINSDPDGQGAAGFVDYISPSNPFTTASGAHRLAMMGVG